MPVITAIHPSRKRPGHLDLEVDGIPLGQLPEQEVLGRGLAVGQPIDEEMLAVLQSAGQLALALALANGFLGHRPRATGEVRRRLRQAHLNESTVDAAIEALTAQGLLNDERFADLWVENRGAFSPRSSRALEMELRRKGVDRESIDTAIARSGDNDASLAIDAGRKRVRSLSSLDEHAFRQRLGGFLARRGFDHESTAAAVEALWREAHDS